MISLDTFSNIDINEIIKIAGLQGRTAIIISSAYNIYNTLNNEIERLYPRATWEIKVNDKHVAKSISLRLISLVLTDNRGLEADTLELVFSDHDGKLLIPDRGAAIEVSLGWSSSGLVYKGMFIVSEIEYSGAPNVLTITATSADLKSSLTAKKERSFDKKKLGDIITQIAHEHELSAHVADELKDKDIYHIDQNESDINLLTRLSEEFDATACIKDDMLLFMPIGSHNSVSGTPLPFALITKSSGDNYRYSETHDIISGVRTYFYDIKKKEKVPVLAGDESYNVREIRYVHRDKAAATDTAVAAYRKAQRGSAHLSITLAHGDPRLIPELPAKVLGIKTYVNDLAWTITNVVHRLDENGYITELELERSLGYESEAKPPIQIGDPKKDAKKAAKKAQQSKKTKHPNSLSEKGKQTRQKKREARAQKASK